MIELRDVTVVLGGRPVVDGISASVGEGEWLALIGPNGAGKTTAVRILTGAPLPVHHERIAECTNSIM